MGVPQLVHTLGELNWPVDLETLLFLMLIMLRRLIWRRSWGRSTRARLTSSTDSRIRCHQSFSQLFGDVQVILNNALDNEKGTTDIQSALMYFDSITKYMQQLRTALEELRDDIEWDLPLTRTNSSLGSVLCLLLFAGMLLKTNSTQLTMRKELGSPSCPSSGNLLLILKTKCLN